MSLRIKILPGENLQVENETDHWLIFSLDELRSRATRLRTDAIGGAPALPPETADLFVWSAFAAARGYAIEHGLIEDDKLPSRT